MKQVQLEKPKHFSQWLRLYRLYLSAFPASERKPFAMIVDMYRKGTTDIWCLRHGGRFVGLAITINGPDVILLDYFAVASNCRGEGIGSGALAALQTCYGEKGLFVEIESTLVDAPNREQRARRKRFYLAAGLEEMGTSVVLFGVEMELLGSRCRLDFDSYHAFYRDHYNQWAANHITRPKE